MGLDEARRHIDEKIAELERSIQQPRLQRNDLAPISQLPPEILSRIFGFVVGKGDPTPPVRFNFSYVSHLWRETALAAHDLWTNLLMEDLDLDWAGVMLERSKTAPLTVHAALRFHSSDKLNKFIKDMLINQGSHLEELVLTARSPWSLAALLKDAVTHHPLLHTLHLEGDATSLPVGWLVGAGRLRDLELRSCSIDWQALPCSNLTDLKICNTIYNYNSPKSPSLSDFVNALRQTTALEVLDVYDSLPSEDAAAYVGKVTLSRLRKLGLSSRFDEIANIVGLFVIPAAVVVHIDCTTSPEQEAQVSSFASSISTLVSTMRSDTTANVSFRELSVSGGGARFNLQAWSAARSEMTASDRVVQVHVSFTTRIPPPMTPSVIFSALVHSLPVSNARKLSFSDDFGDMTDTTLVESFGLSLGRVTHISVSGSSLPTVTEALQCYTEKNSKTSETSQSQIVFPKLTTLQVDQGIFDDSHSDGISIEVFQDMLMKRCEWRAPLQILSITECFEFIEEDVKLLKEIVVTVDWDKFESGVYEVDA